MATLGYATNGVLLGGGFRTTYSRTSEGGSNPEITLSMQQMYLPGRGDAVPVLRTATVGMYDQVELTDRLKAGVWIQL